MSRSKRKPWDTGTPGRSKRKKREASKKVRRAKGYIPKGKAYKDYYDSDDIHERHARFPLRKELKRK